MLLLQAEINSIDIFNLFSSITSIILGIVAIVLSILFYRMSEKSSRENEKISTNIESNVNKLEDLFNKLYTGTFDMMKETVTDMRRHVYKSETESSESKIDQKVIHDTINSLSEEIQQLKSRKIDGKEFDKIVEEILTKSKKIESNIKKEKIREEIISFLRVNGKATYIDIDKYLKEKGLSGSLFTELEKLVESGIINDPFEKLSNGQKAISHSEIIFLL